MLAWTQAVGKVILLSCCSVSKLADWSENCILTVLEIIELVYVGTSAGATIPNKSIYIWTTIYLGVIIWSYLLLLEILIGVQEVGTHSSWESSLAKGTSPSHSSALYLGTVRTLESYYSSLSNNSRTIFATGGPDDLNSARIVVDECHSEHYFIVYLIELVTGSAPKWSAGICPKVLTITIWIYRQLSKLPIYMIFCNNTTGISLLPQDSTDEQLSELLLQQDLYLNALESRF